MSVIEIKSRFTGAVIFSGDFESLRDAVLAALKSNANLSCADLSNANLRNANLSYADLRNANLSNANLSDANLSYANLSNAYLSDANLRDANLSGAKIDGEVINAKPILVQGLIWWVLITEGFMRIGCQRHAHAEWAAFDADAIRNMESRATAFWSAHKEVLLGLCKIQAAKAPSAA
jgi:uncharacterized protein YjbI with pentapeptide repeats